MSAVRKPYRCHGHLAHLSSADRFLHTLGHFCRQAQPGASGAKSDMLLVGAMVGNGQSSAGDGAVGRSVSRRTRMDGFNGPQRETGTHPGESPGLLDGQWLAPFLLLYVRDGYARVGELAEKLDDLGLGSITPDRVQRTLRQMKEEGLVEEGRPRSGRKRYGLTVVGESYLDFWGDSLEQYRETLGLFLRLYRDGKDGQKGPARVFTNRGSGGRGGAGAVFVLTSSGLRQMGPQPGPPDRRRWRVSRLPPGGDLLERRLRSRSQRRPAPPLVPRLPRHGGAWSLGEHRGSFPRRTRRLDPYGRLRAERAGGPHGRRHGTSRGERASREERYPRRRRDAEREPLSARRQGYL